MPDAILIPMSEAVKNIHKESLDNILFLKRQQWTLTNYAMLTYAAVVFISKGGNNVELTLLTIFAASTFIYAAYCMGHTQWTMTKYRSRLAFIYETYFTDDEKKVLKLWPTPPSFHYTPAFFYGLLVVHVFAAATAIYLIWRGLH